ncbi:MAG: metallophosphoesterase family protein [Anaerolineales bacterium]
MKLGLISDVHGDLPALQQALALLEQRHHVDAVWCAGDIVGLGTQPDEVARVVVAGGIPTVMGKYDEMMLTPQQDIAGVHVLMGEIFGYAPRTMQLLATLPRTYRARFGAQSVVMVHGTPLTNTQGISPNLAQRQAALAWLRKTGADILITGHTHHPVMIRAAQGMVVNPGSLFSSAGARRYSSQTYGVLDVAARQFNYYALW